METLTKLMIENLKPEAVKKRAINENMTEEEIVFDIMKSVPTMCGAMADWDDIRQICIAVIRELKPFLSWKDIYVFVMKIVNIYDTQVICVYRAFSDATRLAYFINEMIESLLEIPAYQEKILRELCLTADEKITLRGVILKRITSNEVQERLITDEGRFFKAEICRAARYSASSFV